MAAKSTSSKTAKETVEIKLAHSPDSDDAFMFYALATHKLSTPGYKYTHVLSDIQTLNDAALDETYDVTAVSFAAYPAQICFARLRRQLWRRLRSHRGFFEAHEERRLSRQAHRRPRAQNDRLPCPETLPTRFRGRGHPV